MFNAVISEVPAEFAIEGGASRPTVTIPLAASDDGSQWVALEVRLWPGHWRGVECHEFKFAIVHFLAQTDEASVIFDRNLAAGYLGSVRELVMPCVCAAGRALLEEVQPEVIYRATYFTRPAEKSLHKQHMVTDFIEGSGYELVQHERDGHGRLFWVMTKAGDE